MKKILIIKTGAIGDVLRTTVLLEGLKDKFVSVRIYWLTSQVARPLLENNPFIEKLFFIENLSPEFFETKYDLIISLEEGIDLLDKIKNVKAKKIFGTYLKDGRVQYTPASRSWYDMSLISRFGSKVADELKKSNLYSYPEMLYKMLELHWTKQRYRLFLVKKELIYSKYLKEKIPKNRTIIGVSVGAGSRWPMKILPVQKQVDLIKKINNKYKDDVQIILLTGPSSLEMANTNIIRKTHRNIITHDVKDIDEFIGIVDLCDIIISPDSMCMHVSIALGKATIGYFTVTSANEIEIYNGKKIRAKHEDYCTYTTENKPSPNISDALNTEEILKEIDSYMNNSINE
jgi:heptosyltransferase II